jgi:outer membrane immunogenic protein
MKKLLMAVTALAALSSAAVAADIPARAPAYKAPAAVTPTYSWTGCYIGAGGGYGMWEQENQTVTVAGRPLDTVTRNGGRGWFGTAGVGCDYQIGNFVIGAFGDWDFGKLHGQMTSAVYGVNGDEDLRWAWGAGGRIGYVIMPQLLGYISGGYTQANFSSVSFFDSVTGGPRGLSVGERTYNGWFLGSGYEYGLNFLLPGLFWKTEYRFASYDNNNERNVLLGVAAVPGDAITSTKFVQTIKSQLVWRFNFGGF